MQTMVAFIRPLHPCSLSRVCCIPQWRSYISDWSHREVTYDFPCSCCLAKLWCVILRFSFRGSVDFVYHSVSRHFLYGFISPWEGPGHGRRLLARCHNFLPFSASYQIEGALSTNKQMVFHLVPVTPTAAFLGARSPKPPTCRSLPVRQLQMSSLQETAEGKGGKLRDKS